MIDQDLANDWLSRTFKDTPLHPQVGKDLEALLARVRLEEHNATCQYCWLGHAGCDRGRTLEQASSGGK